MMPTRGFTISAHALTGTVTSDESLAAWLEEQKHANRFEVRQIEFGDMDGWHFEPDSGDLVHRTGRFFRVEGLQVTTDHPDHGSWMQPILNQPEIGLLGIVMRSFDGVPHCLLQAKMEPGNLNTIQLSPTVQATRSNYTRVHGGRQTPYLEYFTGPRRGRVLVDSNQSEQGSWFLSKRNRNVVVEVTEDVPLLDNFRWVTIGQLHRLLQQDNTVNMDTRTVLACIPFEPPNGGRRAELDGGAYREALVGSLAADQFSLHGMDQVLGWLTETKARHLFVRRYVPLGSVRGWHRSAADISHEQGKYFKVVAVDVTAGNREVTRWTQPMFAPVGQGRVAFLVRSIKGVLHVLMHARLLAGCLDVVELAPTLQHNPGNSADLPADRRPRFLDLVAGAAPEQIRYDAVQSEEGGRFHHARTRHQIIDVGEDFPTDEPEEYRWMTVRQLTELLRHSSYLNIEARSLLAALHTTW
uniref:SsfS3 n=1 Tax=Streptomyces sp. SF2575 TaxID=746675 RepID=D6MSX2_9ACTN|nr:SsfS3 [Streptomyces sp. SF2575]